MLSAKETKYMEKEKKIELLKLFGLSEDMANYYAESDDDKLWSVLPVFRLLRPLNVTLEYYENHFAKYIEGARENVSLQRMPEVAALLQSGATPEQIAKFAYSLTLSAYEEILYLLDDHSAADNDSFMNVEKECEDCTYWKLVEISSNGEKNRTLFIGGSWKVTI